MDGFVATYDNLFLPGLSAIVGILCLSWGFDRQRWADSYRTSMELQEQSHHHTLEITDATKATVSKADMEYQLKRLAEEMKLELRRLDDKVSYEQRREKHLRWTTLTKMISELVSSILLVQVELRENPAFEDIL